MGNGAKAGLSVTILKWHGLQLKIQLKVKEAFGIVSLWFGLWRNNWRFEKWGFARQWNEFIFRKCILSLWAYLLCICTSFVHSVQCRICTFYVYFYVASLVLNRDLFVFILKHSFSDVMGETKGNKIGTLCCRGLKPLVIRGYAAVFTYWFRTFGHAKQYGEAIITAEDGSQRVIPKGNLMSSHGKL